MNIVAQLKNFSHGEKEEFVDGQFFESNAYEYMLQILQIEE